jgi:hypothetical protein
MNDVLLETIQAEANGDLILSDISTLLLNELTGAERERFLYVFIRPGDATYHLYAHLSQFASREDDEWSLYPDLEDEEG